jgi:mono/diheme cytochrome c family protein
MKVQFSLLALLTVVLAACEGPPGDDPKDVMRRYRGRYSAPCNSWVKSQVTGTKYCSSPQLDFSTAAAYAAAAPAAPTTNPAFDTFDTMSADDQKALLLSEGEKVYTANCVACHQAAGTGLAGSFPPLAGDPLANGGPAEEHIHVVLNGLSGKAINGVSYAAAMTPFSAQLSDAQIASVITYERNSWGNSGGVVAPKQVADARK